MQKEGSALGVSYSLLTSSPFSLIPVLQLPRPPSCTPLASLPGFSPMRTWLHPGSGGHCSDPLSQHAPRHPVPGSGSSEGTAAGTSRESWARVLPLPCREEPMCGPSGPPWRTLRVPLGPLPSSSRDFSSWMTVMMPVLPRLFWTLEKASRAKKKVMMRRTRECEQGKKSKPPR